MNHLHIQKVLVGYLDEELAHFFLDPDGFEIREEKRTAREVAQYEQLRAFRERIAAAGATPQLDAACRDLPAWNGRGR